jgi:site-specific recombinase XerD
MPLAPRHMNGASRSTQRIEPELGAVRIDKLGVPEIQAFKAQMLRSGTPPAVGEDALSAFLDLHASGRMGPAARQPVRAVKKPPAKRRMFPTVLSPALAEAIRAEMLAANHQDSLIGLRNATLISVMAYAGLRPGEAVSLPNRPLDKVLYIEASVSDGELKGTKTGEPQECSLARSPKSRHRPMAGGGGRLGRAPLPRT